MELAHHDPASSRYPRAAVAGLTLLLGGVGLFIWRNYSIRAWSDPINWLLFARNLRTEFFHSRFACGYALFLALVEPITGPYWVFLSNLPLLLALFVAVGCAAAFALPDDAHRLRPVAALTAGAFLALADPASLLVLSQPYRDTLAHLLLFVSLAMTVRYLRPEPAPAWALFVAGLAFGAAYSVREPSLLMAAPLVGVVIAHHRVHPSSRMTKRLIWAALGVALGASPLLIQSLVRSGTSGLLPPQSLAEQRLLPGLHLSAIGSTGREVCRYLGTWSSARPWLLCTWLVGLCVAARRHHHAVFGLLALPAAMYGLFYSFYWTFVPRYLWVVWLFAAATTGWLIAVAIHSAAARWGRRNLVPIAVVVSGLVAMGTGIALGLLRGTEPRFTIADARRLSHDVGQIIPMGAPLLAPRHFCEIVRWFNRLDSWPASWKWDPRASNPVPSLRTAMAAHFAAGKPVYAGEVQLRGRRDIEFNAIARAFETTPIGKLHLAEYGLGDGTVTFYRLRPWTNTVQEWSLVTPASNLVLAIDADQLESPASIHLGSAEPLPARSGVNFFRVDGPGTILLRLCASHPVPRLPVRLFAPTEPITMDFDMSAPLNCHGWLGSGFDLPPYGLAGPRVQERAHGFIPAAILAPGEAHWAVVRLRGTRLRRNTVITFTIAIGSNEWVRAVPMDRRFHDVQVGPWPVAKSSSDFFWTITIVQPAPDRALELDSITVRRENAQGTFAESVSNSRSTSSGPDEEHR